MMYQQPMYYHQEAMYPSSMYEQMMHYPSMHHQVDGCEKPSTPCEDKEQQVKGYYEDMKQMENMTKSHGTQNYYPHSYEQWH